jgi:hypothetical protein
MLNHPIRAVSFALAALLISASSQAQYVWLDEKGSKQFSDMPPPVTVPKNRILKTPLKAAQNPASAEASAASSAVPSVEEKLQKPVTTASKNEDFMKRKADQEEKEKKAAAEKQAAADKAKNCERARSYQQSLEAGVRIANTDKNGERNFLSDEQRAKELADVKQALAECK